MNTRNDWENLLRYANEDLEKTGYSLLVTKDDDGYYSCEIRRDGDLVEVYAENFYEGELSDLITDASAYARNLTKRRERGIAVKRTSVTPEDIKRTKRVLLDNGIEPDEVDSVLQAIGYTLIDTELYPYPECEEYMS